MPNPILSDKNKGKSFADISKSIQSKYADRFDPISQKGLMAEMNTLKEEQEYKKAKMEIEEQLRQQLNPQQPSQEQFNPMGQEQIQPPINNMGAGIDMPQQGQDTNFNREASQSYNQEFAYGGKMKYGGGGPFDSINELPSSGIESKMFNEFLNKSFLNQQPGLNIQAPNVDITPSFSQAVQFPTKNNTGDAQSNSMRYAPMAANIYSMLSARKPTSNMAKMQNMGYNTSVDPSLATRVQPRQTQFSNIDFNPIERGIQDQGRGFTANNINVSSGNAGAFRSNELANTSNMMKAISNARMQQGQSNQQTQAMNAQEQARVDGFRQNQNQMLAGIQGSNMQMGMQLADLDARNLGAFNNMKNANITGLATNLGAMGKESDRMKMISKALGYNSFGEYIKSLPKKDQANAISQLLGLNRS